MGVPISELYATNVGDNGHGEIMISSWIPEKHEDGKYYWPKETPIGLNHWVPNVLGLTEEEGPVRVEIVPSETETGIWMICFDDYFGNEHHLYAGIKPRFIEGTKNVDWKYFHEMTDNDDNANPFTLHVSSRHISMVAGEGPIAVTLQRYIEEEEKS